MTVKYEKEDVKTVSEIKARKPTFISWLFYAVK